jgi:hypothetical protein
MFVPRGGERGIASSAHMSTQVEVWAGTEGMFVQGKLHRACVLLAVSSAFAESSNPGGFSTDTCKPTTAWSGECLLAWKTAHACAAYLEASS